MRWEDERYVRVYTRDTGDWLSLSFEAQAVFLMLLRKVDRIGELHLGKRGRSAIPALIGHGGAPIDSAIGELLADGCIRLRDGDGVLFVPNFLKAQETAKSPTERKREQRERDAAQALEKTELSRDVTQVTIGHEMSPRAVPCRTVPNPPNHAEPELPLSTSSTEGPESPGARVVFEHWCAVMEKGDRAKFKGKRRRAVLARLKDGYSPEDLMAAVDGCAKTPHNMGQNDRGERYDDLELICRDETHVERFRANATAPPRPRGDPHKSPVRAESIPLALHQPTGTVADF